MKHTIFIIFLFLQSTFIGCKKTELIEKNIPLEQFSEVTQIIAKNSGIIKTVYSDTVINIAKGVDEIEIHFLDMRGYTTRAFIQRIDLNTPGLSLEVGTPFDLASEGGAQTVLEMARYADRPNHRILGAVNADFYNTANYILRGPMHKNGQIIKSTFTPSAALPQQALSFMGILNNGKVYIGYRDEYEGLKSQMTEVTGGGVLLMKDNQPVDNSNFPQVDPRIAIGYTDNNVVYFVIIDGRDFYNSNGMTYDYLSKLFNSLGVNSAVNLDGGGSCSMIILNPLANVWQMRNITSDVKPRAVANAWLVVSDQP